MDAHHTVLDARVAEAAEAWLDDPSDVTRYVRLIAAVEDRRTWLDRQLDRGDSALSESPDPDADPRHHDAAADSADDEEAAWPSVRAVGVDLAGDPVAVLRRLRGG